jgi:hypothetical protein
MFKRLDKTKTEHRQFIDNTNIDEVIETKIKACQRENGRCMGSTASRLRKKYGDMKVNQVLSRLSQRRYRGNRYQEQESSEIINLLEKLSKNIGSI